MKLSSKLETILLKIKHPIAQELLTYAGNKYDSLDVTGDGTMLSTSAGKHSNTIKLSKIVKFLLGKKYSDKDIYEFTGLYKKTYDMDGEQELKTEVSPILKWVIDTFEELTSETYPHGYEEEVWPKLGLEGFTQDEHGNYFKIVGNDPTTMFTSHLDTASHKKEKTAFLLGRDRKTKDIWAYTDGSTILGADDKSGVVVMMHMLKNNIPGIYYFFIGEERGAIGSSAVAYEFEGIPHLSKVNKCISFDRRDFFSVITSQLGRQCCSSAFGQAIADGLGLGMSLDPTGVFTDSASFIDLIPECTNISVGYFNEHTGQEKQNLTYLSRLCEAVIKVDWANLPVERKLDIDEQLKIKHKILIALVRTRYFSNDIKMYGDDGYFYISLSVDEGPLEDFYNDIKSLEEVLKQNGNPDYLLELDSNQVKIKFI